MGKIFYRFRSVDNLLGDRSELEKQAIYFASPDQLNDPMEGYRDIFWRGDLIAWKNLFSHYVFCLERLCSLFLISGEDQKIEAGDIPVFGSTNDLLTDDDKNLFRKVKDRFLNNKDISALILSISKRSIPVRREELSFYYECIHPPALKLIFDVFIEENLSQESNRFDDDVFSALKDVVSKDFPGQIEKLLANGDADQTVVNETFKSKCQIKQQLNLIYKHNELICNSNSNETLIRIEFPTIYLSRLEEITFPKWYTSCFMSECNNSSVWGHYGNNHEGMCLIFNPESINHKHYIKLNGITGCSSSGPIYGNKPLEFYPIDYKKGFEEIDFFTSIGSLPVPVLNAMWYMDEKGNTSVCANQMHVDEDTWRTNYWTNFIQSLTVKSIDWEYENEYRLILHSSETDLSDKNSRTLTYDFSSLNGIIFGIKTKEEDKIKAIKIIEEKCRKNSRSDFKFYQAYYCPRQNCIKHSEMGLVRFSGNL